MFDLFIRGGSLSDSSDGKAMSMRETQRQIFSGMKITLQKWWLVMRCSSIGTLMGLVPGLGSAPAAFVAYGHAKQTSKDKASFGKGNIEGVIGSEAANDAVEGGALASTIAFGIPGSSSMAILLGGLFILGMETGPRMMISHLDIVFVMIFTIVIGNLIGTIFGMFLVNPLTRATFLRSTILVPVLVCIVFTGAFVVHNAWFEMLIALVFGVLGYVMKELSYSRAAMLIGLVLGYAIEKNLYLALQLNGPRFYLDPIPLTLVVITVAFLGWNIWTYVRDRKKGA